MSRWDWKGTHAMRRAPKIGRTLKCDSKLGPLTDAERRKIREVLRHK
jgi:hypothetical protein